MSKKNNNQLLTTGFKGSTPVLLMIKLLGKPDNITAILQSLYKCSGMSPTPLKAPLIAP